MHLTSCTLPYLTSLHFTAHSSPSNSVSNVGNLFLRYFFIVGFAVILLVLFYLQKGCTLPVIPSLQESFPRHFGTTSTALSLAEKLCGSNKETVPFDVRAYRSRNSQTLGDLFVGFFKFYSTFSWEKVISVRKGDYVPLGYGGTWRKPHIRIEDPYQLGNVTKAVYEYGTSSAIKQAFKTALETLQINPSLASIM
jgi:poly(A) RNA polymerase GLD2